MALILNSLKLVETSYLIVLALSMSGGCSASGKLIQTEVSWCINAGMLLLFLVGLFMS